MVVYRGGVRFDTGKKRFFPGIGGSSGGSSLSQNHQVHSMTTVAQKANASSRMKRKMIPTDLHRSGSSPHSAGRRQGDVDERYSAAVDRDGIGLGSHRSVA